VWFFLTWREGCGKKRDWMANSYFFFSGTSVDTVFMAALIFFSVSAEISFKQRESLRAS
jgi:hypothetical protein